MTSARLCGATALALLGVFNSHAQVGEPMWLTALYFEDAVGNRDTVEIGYDPRVDAEFDYPAEELGQFVDRTPFDSVFEVRVKHSSDHRTALPPSSEWYNRLVSTAWQAHPQRGCFQETVAAVFAIRARHQPITVSWDPSAFTSNFCHIGAIIAQHNWVARYEGNAGPFWWQGYPEYLDSTRCLAIDSTWTTTLRLGDQGFLLGEPDLAVVPGRGGTFDTLYTMRVYVVSERWIVSPCDVRFVSSVETAPIQQQRVRLGPNPASGRVRFHDGIPRLYRVYDGLGREMLRGTAPEIDVSLVPAGVYLVVGDGWYEPLVVLD